MGNIISHIKNQAKTSFAGRRKWAHAAILLVMVLYNAQGLFSARAMSGATYGFYIGYIFINLFFFIGISYSFLLLLLPVFYARRNKLLFWLGFTGNIIFWLLLKAVVYKLWVLLFPAMNTMKALSMASISQRSAQDLYVFIFFLCAYYFIDIYNHQQELRRLERLKTEKIKLEASLLQSQVNPHFLFNTLNNIYSLSLVQSPETRTVITKLRSLLHYMLYDCQAAMVPLEQELGFMSSYISLERIRLKEDQCTITTNITGKAADRQIAPLLLINFLENAFKHGVKAGTGKSWITMQIDVQPGSLSFDLRNSKPVYTDNSLALNEYTGGIGVQNVKRRLEILYPQRHSLQIDEQPGSFHVSLQIKF